MDLAQEVVVVQNNDIYLTLNSLTIPYIKDYVLNADNLRFSVKIVRTKYLIVEQLLCFTYKVLFWQLPKLILLRWYLYISVYQRS